MRQFNFNCDLMPYGLVTYTPTESISRRNLVGHRLVKRRYKLANFCDHVSNFFHSWYLNSY